MQSKRLGNNAIHAIERAMGWGERAGLHSWPFSTRRYPRANERAGIVVFYFCQGRLEYNYGEHFETWRGMD